MTQARSGVCRECLTAFQLPLMTCRCGKCLPSTQPAAPVEPITTVQEDAEGNKSVGEGDAFEFAAMIQHPKETGKGATQSPGKVRLQIIAAKANSAVLFSLQHPDGTALAAFFRPEDMGSVVHLFDHVGAQALVLDKAIKGKKQ